MSVVDVDKLIKEKENSEKVSEMKEQAEDKKMKRKIDPQHQKIEIGKPVQQPRPDPVLHREHILGMIQEMREQRESENEMKAGLKNGIFYVASLPIRRDKRRRLHNSLKTSKFLNKYIDNNLYVDYLERANSELKAMACYGYHYLQALKDDIEPPIES